MTDKGDKFLIHEYVRDGKLLLVQQLLGEEPKLVLRKDDDERTPLHWACTMNNAEMVDFLVQPRNGVKEIDIDEMTDASGWTPLHIASSLGNGLIVDTLMKQTPEPDIDLATIQGTTPLHLAISKNHYDLARKLVVDYKCSCRKKDKSGYTGLHRAASIGSWPIVKLVVEVGKVNVNAQDNNGWTAMHHALAEGHGDIAVELVRLGGDFTIKNSDDETPADVAVDEKVKSYFENHL